MLYKLPENKKSLPGLILKGMLIVSLILFGLFLINCSSGKDKIADIPQSPFVKMQELSWTDVTWTEGFWADKFKLCNDRVIPAVYNGFMDPKNSEHIDNLKKAAGMMEGKFEGLDFSDGDSYKWIESLAFMYAVTKDEALDSIMDDWIGAIAKAQLPNGYISTNMQMKKRTPYMEAKTGRMPGTFHEMYNMGHLLTAACTHYRATGKDNFLNVARKLADHLVSTFKHGAPELRIMAGNLPNFMGLVDMYRVTGEKRYLEAALVPVDIRGHMPDTTDFTQDHVPFRDETEATGHSVFATYLYAGVADIVAETGDTSLKKALDRIWQSAALRRTYITGGVCALPEGVSARGDIIHEAFGADYQLPNRTAYNETCANVGNAMWNWRMLKLSGDAKYADMMETVLYNSMLSALSADGTNFFYANPLKWDFNKQGQGKNHTATRWATHSCYCCPPQLARTIAGLGRWFYGVSNDTLWVNLYGGNTLQTKLPGGKEIALTQETNYPWEGEVKITLGKVPANSISVMIRIPDWAEGATIKINGEKYNGTLNHGTYAAISRKWSRGDVVELSLPMQARFMEAHPKVEDCKNSVAVMRGPIVYCAEFPKEENGEQIWNNGVSLSANSVLTPKMESEMFGGVVVLKGKAITKNDQKLLVKKNEQVSSVVDSSGWNQMLYRQLIPSQEASSGTGSQDLTLIPYFTWANRGPAYMSVWIPLLK
jgi:hypothetical protein